MCDRQDNSADPYSIAGPGAGSDSSASGADVTKVPRYVRLRGLSGLRSKGQQCLQVTQCMVRPCVARGKGYGATVDETRSGKPAMSEAPRARQSDLDLAREL